MTNIGSLREYGSIFLATLVFGCAISLVPIIRDFHLESAIAVSVIFSFVSIHIACIDRHSIGFKYCLTFLMHGIFVLPIAIVALYNGCFSLDGILFQLLIPYTSISFVLTLTVFLKRYVQGIKKYHVVLIVLALAVIPPMVALKSLPHLFLFNIMWGWFPGPIYDESVIIGMPLVWHRLFVVLLTAIITAGLFRSSVKRSLIIMILLTLILVHLYNWKKFGIVYPASYIEQSLGGRSESDHFVLIYDQQAVSDEEVKYWHFWHEFHLKDLQVLLQVGETNKKITSFLYRDGWQKQQYTGARRTSYVPVWNKRDQLHLDRQTGAAVLRHELVHILLKPYANPLIGASLNIGLTEGVAVANEDPRFKRMTNSEAVVNSGIDHNFDYLKKIFSFLGFYSGRPSVNYTVSGSFIEYILEEGFVDEFKCAYKGSSMLTCFGSDLQDLYNGWTYYLKSIPEDTTYKPYAMELFSRESLFEKKCSRIPSEFEIKLNNFQLLLTRGNLEEALVILGELVQKYPTSNNLWNSYTYLNLQHGKPQVVFESYDPGITETNEMSLLRFADAAFMMGDYINAKIWIELFVDRTSGTTNAGNLNYRGILLDDKQPIYNYDVWSLFVRSYYNPRTVSPELLSSLSSEQTNLWLSALRTQQTGNDVVMYDYIQYLRISTLTRENLMFLTDSLIPYYIYGINSENISYSLNLAEIVDQIELLSTSLIHYEQVNLLNRAIRN